MQVKTVFIESIMQVLRLEPNMYTIGAIEDIIDRLEISDYQLFIAFLGQRESKYEKPIQSIANAVDEFIDVKVRKEVEPVLKLFRKSVNACNAIVNFNYEREKEKYDKKVVDMSFEERIETGEPHIKNFQEKLIEKGCEILLEFRYEDRDVFSEDDLFFIRDFGFERIVMYGETNKMRHTVDMVEYGDKDAFVVGNYLREKKNKKSIENKILDNTNDDIKKIVGGLIKSIGK